VLDLGRLESILHHIQNDDYYPSFIDKLTHLVYAVNKGHCFSDGNKRTSIALGAFLMEVNGLDVLVSKFMIEMENVALGDIIDSLLNEEEYNEPLQLRIINCLDIYNNDPDAETI